MKNRYLFALTATLAITLTFCLGVVMDRPDREERRLESVSTSESDTLKYEINKMKVEDSKIYRHLKIMGYTDIYLKESKGDFRLVAEMSPEDADAQNIDNKDKPSLLKKTMIIDARIIGCAAFFEGGLKQEQIGYFLDQGPSGGCDEFIKFLDDHWYNVYDVDKDCNGDNLIHNL